jgi:hypothetical protein
MSFTNKKFREVDFGQKNWPNDSRIRCKSPSNLLKFLERDIDVEEELEKFEGNLKGMKLLKCKSSINKLMVILEFFSNIAYNVFIVKKRNKINYYLF